MFALRLIRTKMADLNVTIIKELRKKRFLLELIKNTSSCCLAWAKIDRTQYKTSKDNFDFYLTSNNSEIILDVHKDGRYASSYRSSENEELTDLFKTIDLIQDKQFNIVAQEEKNLIELLRWCRCTNTWDEYPEGGVVVGGDAEVYQPQRIFEEMNGGVVVNSSADWRQPERYQEIMNGGVVVGGNIQTSIFDGCVCNNSDILLVIDTTGSMGGLISKFADLLEEVLVVMDSPTCRIGLVTYKDFEDSGYSSGWRVDSTFTNNFNGVSNLVSNLRVGGGGDGPEQQLATLKLAAEQWESRLFGRPDPNVKRVIAWAGDIHGWANGAKGRPFPTVNEVIDAMTASNIKVVALNGQNFGNGLDFGIVGNDEQPPWQATSIAAATNGLVIDDVTNLPIDDVIEQFCEAINVT